MGIKVQYSDRSAIYLIESSKGWKSNAMIAAQCEELGLRIGRVGESWDAKTEFEESSCHLVESKSIVKRRNRDVTTVKDSIW